MGGKKKRQQNQCITANDDAPEQANGVNCENSAELSSTPKCFCQHLAKSVVPPRIYKNIKATDVGKFTCMICSKKDGVIPPSDERWICLQCGQRQCSKEHSLQHFATPRSESHCLAFSVNDGQVWCHDCNVMVPDDGSKKLKDCLPQIKNMMDQLQRANSIDPSSSDEMPPPLLKMDEKGGGAAIPLPPALPAPHIPPTTNCLNNNNNINRAKKFDLKSRSIAVTGLMNLGNTCFFNSVLQCLARTPNLVDTLRLMDSDEQHIFVQLESGDNLEGRLEKSGDALGPALSDVLDSLRVRGSTVKPDRLLTLLRKRCPQFEGYDQHDAHELLRHLLDNVRLADHKRYQALMLTKMGLTKKVNPSGVPEELQKKLKALDHEVVDKVTLVPDHVFKGKLISTLECQDCRSQSHRVESFLDLSLPIVVDKPQPPCILRRKPASPEPEETDDSYSRRRRLKGKPTPSRRRGKRQDDPPSAMVNNTSDRGESDADVEDNEDGERNRLESGYSSEKAEDEEQETRASGASDDSARASPASGWTQTVQKLHLKNGGDPVVVCAGALPVPSSDALISELRNRLGPCPEQRERWEWRREERQDTSDKLTLSRPGQASLETAFRDPSKIPTDDDIFQTLPRKGHPPTAHIGPSGDSADTELHRMSNLVTPVFEASITKVLEGILPSTQEVNERLGNLSLNSPVSTSCEISGPNVSNELPDSATNGDVVETVYNNVEANCQPDTSTIPIVLDSCEVDPSCTELNLSIAKENDVELSCEPPSGITGSPQVLIEVDVDSPSLSPILHPVNNSERDKGSDRSRVRGPPRPDDNREGECSVQSCLSQFISRELLTGANRVGCSTCTKNRGNKDGKVVCTDASKQFLIKEAPQVLILHLKRFQVQMYSFRKLSKLVVFPLVLDLAPFCEPELQKNEEGNLMYSLYGVVEHSGTLNGGHYVAYIKVDNEDDDEEGASSRWFCISDAHVTEVTENRVLTSQAYLLFYKRFSRS